MEKNSIEGRLPSFLIKSSIYDIVVTDLSGDYIYVNNNFKSRFSFLTDDFIGKPSATSFHPDDLSKAEEAVFKCLSDPEQPVNLQLRKPLKTEHGYYWTQWEFSVMQNDESQPMGILCIGYDITETKYNTGELKRSQIKLNKIIESIPHPLLILNNDFKVKYVNPEFENIFEYSFSEVVDEPLKTLFMDENTDDYYSLIEKYNSNDKKSVVHDEFIFVKTKSKESKFIGVNINSFKDHHDESNYVLILQDLTAFKQNQEVIIKQNKALREIAQKHSHEIRKPVSNIMALSELIKLDANYIRNIETLKFIKESAIDLDKITKAVVEEANKNEYEVILEPNKRNLF